MTLADLPYAGPLTDVPERLAAVRRLHVAAGTADPDLDAVVRTLSLACGVPIAVVNVVTPDRQTYLAEVGVGRPCTDVPDELSPCAEVVTTGRPLVVEDATAHPRYRENPLVQAGAIRSYAGVPLVSDGEVVGAISVFDTAPRRFDEEQLAVLAAQARLAAAVLSLRGVAVWDRLTGLGTRALLLDRLDRAASRAAADRDVAAVVVLDVVGTGRINARLGSAGGDRVLRAVADRLAAVVGPRESLARVGGDAFGVVLEGLSGPEDARARAAELVAAVRGPLLVDGRSVLLDLSRGVATTPAGDADALLSAAEEAAGHDTAGSAGPDLDDEVADRLRTGLERGEVVLHGQPVLDLSTGAVVGVEMLVRWEHPTLGLLPPSQFVPVADRSDLGLLLGEHVVRSAATRLARWLAAGRDLHVGVNLSPRQLADPAFVDVVRSVLAETGVPADRLVTEFVETDVLDQPAAPAVLAGLQQLGVRMALDDFGTGASSLSYLRRYPVDAVKVDRSFVAGLGRSGDDEAIVAAVASLGAAVDKLVVAVGVETPEQLAALRGLGVPYAQGFLWTPALPLDELDAWLRRHDDAPTLCAPAARPVRVEVAQPSAGGAVEDRIWGMHCDGASLSTIAAALNAEGLRTARGVRWHTRSVALVVADRARAEAVGTLAPEQAVAQATPS